MYLACLPILFLIVGCKEIIMVTPKNTSAMPTPIVDVTPTFPTSTYTASTPPSTIEIVVSTTRPTNEATPTPEFPYEAQLSLKCLDVLPNLPTTLRSNGRIILNSLNADSNGSLIFDMTTRSTATISEAGEIPGDFVLSSNRKLVAYSIAMKNLGYPVLPSQIVIADSMGMRLRLIDYGSMWQDLLGWLDDTHLIISKHNPDINQNQIVVHANDYHSYIILDITNGKERIVTPHFDGQVSGVSVPFWDGWYGVMYDPTFTRAIYLRSIPDQNDMYTFALWDVTNQKLIASFEDIFIKYLDNNIIAPMPHWSTDGSKFGIVGNGLGQGIFELFVVSRDGQFEQVTHLNKAAFLMGLQFEWSPDGQKIAMYMDTLYGMKGYSAAVLDLETKQVTDYCIPLREVTEESTLFWSPDSTEFLIEDRKLEKTTSYDIIRSRVVLVDIIQGSAALIAEDMEPVGWMVNK